MSNLEKFIKENREAFDSEMPSLKVWAGIDQKMNAGQSAKRIPMRRIFSIAAAIAVILAVGGAIGSYLTKNPVNVAIVAGEPDVPEQYQEVEHFYRKQYEEKVNQLVNYQVDPDMKTELQQFEAVITELKEELQNAPKGNEERIVATLIENYQTKIEVLQRVLDRIQSVQPQTENSKTDEVSL